MIRQKPGGDRSTDSGAASPEHRGASTGSDAPGGMVGQTSEPKPVTSGGAGDEYLSFREMSDGRAMARCFSLRRAVHVIRRPALKLPGVGRIGFRWLPPPRENSRTHPTEYEP
jgi:hypothetical protein